MVKNNIETMTEETMNDEREVPMNESIDHTIKKSYTQWLIKENEFRPIGRTMKNLIPGFYKIKFDHNLGISYLKKQTISSEKIIEFPDKTISNLINDIETFWESKEKYLEYNFVYKRGYLLYGVPGGGKTSVIHLLSDKLINQYGGVVINIGTVNDLFNLEEIIETIKTIEQNIKIILVFEDIDNFNDSDKEVMSTLLNVLDGNMRIDSCVIVATTNYPEKLKERISNRPSRFDVRYEIKLPTIENRKHYLNKFLKAKDLEQINIDKLVKDTDGFTVDHIKELILSVFVLNKDYNFALKEIKHMKDNSRIKPVKIKPETAIGFTTKQYDDYE
jgi:SpoVK/Ycf46/Vps4 family AAA+-type ATPase